MTTHTPEPPFRWRSVAVPAFGPTALASLGTGAIIPVLPLRAGELGASAPVAALVAALLGVGQLVAVLPAGALVARIGERRALLWATAVDVVALAVAGLAQSVWLLAVTAMITGMSTAVLFLARHGFMIDAIPSHLRARGMSTLGGAMRIGVFIGPLLAAAAMSVAGTAAAWAVASVASAAAFALVLTMPELGDDGRHSDDGPAPVLRVLRAHRRVLLTLGLVVAVISALRQLRTTVLPLWADHIGLDPVQVALVFAVGGLVEVFLFYPAGWAMDHFGRMWIAVPLVVIISTALVLLPLVVSLPALIAVTVAMAVGNGLGAGIVMTLGADVAPTLDRAQFLGGWRMCGEIGHAGGPLLLSALVGVVSLAAASVTLGVIGLAMVAFIVRWVGDLDRQRARS
ncbi:MFS transporter [Janibacter sp. G1551]|uniref:MFS transporter n=1 Tax=Janibacter sp. G1551 TaxID=3420440 RepID=UPI003D02CE85